MIPCTALYTTTYTAKLAVLIYRKRLFIPYMVKWALRLLFEAMLGTFSTAAKRRRLPAHVMTAAGRGSRDAEQLKAHSMQRQATE